MSGRARHHLAWESQPLLRPAVRRRSPALALVVIAFLAGLLIGLML